MSASYKPALLKALVRELATDPVSPLTLTRLGERFIRLYWTQTVVYRLRQAKTLHAEPEIVRSIRSAAEFARVRRFEDLPAAAKSALVRKTARLLTINVLGAFHASAPQAMPPLFTWRPDASALEMTHEAVEFVVRERSALESLANLWWARYLEGVNRLAPAIIAKVEGTSAHRRSLQPYLRILRETDPAECFYCGTNLGESTTTHVDHVIPWSFLYADELWDLVLACDSCNIAKADALPVRPFLAKLATYNERRAHVRLGAANVSALIPSHEIVRLYDAALSVEWPAGWMPARLPP